LNFCDISIGDEYNTDVDITEEIPLFSYCSLLIAHFFSKPTAHHFDKR
jgi:hypothetical protein